MQMDKDMYIVPTLPRKVPFARNMSQATSHCLKCINLLSFCGRMIDKKVSFTLALAWLGKPMALNPQYIDISKMSKPVSIVMETIALPAMGVSLIIPLLVSYSIEDVRR